MNQAQDSDSKSQVKKLNPVSSSSAAGPDGPTAELLLNSPLVNTLILLLPQETCENTEYDQLPGPTILQLLYYSERILRIPMIMDTGRQARTEVWPCTSSSDKVITDKVFPPVLHQGRAQGVEP